MRINNASLNLNDLYQLYLNECNKNNINQISRKEYLTIINEYFEEIKDLIINRLLPYTMPCSLGDLCVYKHKQRKPLVDWLYYHKTGKCVPNTNRDTSGWTFMTRWIPSSWSFRNKWFLYTFRFSRRCWKQLISNKVLEGQDYEEYDGRKINKY